MKSIKYIFSGFLLLVVISSAQAQKKQTNPFEIKGDKAYESLLYADALEQYKQALKSSRSAQSSQDLSLKIADCYWLIRNYDSAYRWYASIPMERININRKDKVRLAELSANFKKYTDAFDMLNNVEGYSIRAVGFTQTPKMLRDSTQWDVKYLEGINTDFFREFSPILIDSSLVWTTNQPKKFTSNGIMGWDNKGYNRLMKAADMNALSPISIPARKVIDISGLDSNKPARLARHYELADVNQNRAVRYPTFISEKLNKINKIAIPIESAGSIKYNIAHAAYAPAQKQLMLSANLQGKLNNATRMLSIASASLQGVLYSEPKFIVEPTLAFSNMHPAVHPEGNLLVFSSNRIGGMGGFDLYTSERDETGNWSTPIMVNGVNTAGNELFPTFGADGRFYFSSDAHPGLGGLDVYSAKFENGRVSDIRHFSYPVNSAYDDFGLTIMADGKKGYFSSDRLGTDDIFMFEKASHLVLLTGKVNSSITKAVKPGVEVVIVEKDDNGEGLGKKIVLTGTAKVDTVAGALVQNGGNASSAVPSNIPTNGATIDTLILAKNLGMVPVNQLLGEASINRSALQEAQTDKTDDNGAYQFWVKPNRSYEIIIKDGSNPVEKLLVNTYGNGTQGYVGEVVINDKLPEPEIPVAPTLTFEPKEFIVYFKFDRDAIRKQYADTLDQVAALMKANDGLVCDLSGHTDQYGTDGYNDNLSERRVVNVRAYLIAAGIPENRILISSFGEKKLVQEFKSKRKSEINRRVEVTLRLAK